MSRPAVEVADILRAQGNRFLDRYEKSFGFQQLKAFRAIRQVMVRAPLLAATGTVRSARHKRGNAG
jgi:hypothetical protein